MADISFVEVVDVGPGWNKVLASDGNIYTLQGDYNWRSNNPGNIEYGPFAKSMGAIGSGAVPPGRTRGFAIFPTYEAGHKAQETLQFESGSYKDKTVAEAVSRYAPPSENDTQSYISAVAAAAGVAADTKMSDMTPEQRRAYMAQQRQVEGFKPGKIIGEEGKPVPASVVRQFSAAPVPPMDIGDKPTARDNIEAQRAEQALMRNRVIPPIPERRPETVAGKVIQPLEAPAPLNPNNPLQQPVDLAAGAVPGSKNPRTGNFSTETNYTGGAGKGVKAEVTYTPPPAPGQVSPTVPARRPDTVPAPAAQEPQRQTATLPSGKTVEVGRIYTINGEDFIGGVNGGVGTLTKAPASIIDEAKGNSVVGQAVRDKVVEEAGKGIKGGVAAVAEAAPKLAQDAMDGLSSIAGNVGTMFGNMFSDKDDKATATVKERSPALASALARLGATVAAKAGVNVSKAAASGTAESMAGAKADVTTSLDLGKSSPSRTTPAPQPAVSASRSTTSIPTLSKTISQIGQEADNGRLSGYRAIQEMGPSSKGAQPQYVTKTRQVLVEDEPAPKAALSAGAGIGAGAGAMLKPITVSGSATGMAGARADAGGSLTYTAPKKPVYRTETYQERNPLYVEPQGPTPEQIEMYKQLQAQKAEAVRLEQEKLKAAALAASQPKITEVGGGGAYLTTPFQEERFQTTTNALMPSSMNNSRWTTGY